MITAEEFKAEYHRSDTWGDAKRLIDKLTVDQQETLLLSIETTDAWVGVTMQENVCIRLLRERKQRRMRESHSSIDMPEEGA